MYSNPEWKRKLWSFSNACSKWGVDQDQINRMNVSIMNAHTIDADLYKMCKYTAEMQCLKDKQTTIGRHPRDDELKKAWHQYIPVNIPMMHPQKGYEL